MFDRHWLRRGLILAAVGLLAVLGACAGEEATPTATATATTAAPVGVTATETVVAEATATVEAPTASVAQIGKYGGTMRWAVKAEWRGVNPIRRTSITEQSFIGPQYSTLIRLDPLDKVRDVSKIVGDLATSWEIEDGKTYVFHLRDNAFFHDGSQVTCQDVVTSWEHSVKVGAYRAQFEDFYLGGECRDSLTPVFKLSAPLAKTLAIMAGHRTAGGAIVPAKQIAAIGGVKSTKEWKQDQTIGSGPFKYESADVAAGWHGIRVDNYYLFDAAGNRLPYLDGYVSFGITDTGTRNAAYLGNQLDAIQSVTLEARSALEILKQKPDHTVITVGGNDWTVRFKKLPPFDDYRVRKAFHLTYDRHANAPITDPSPPGIQWRTVGGIVPPQTGGIPLEELWQMPGFRVDKTADIAEANRLLDEAGYPRGKNGIRFAFKLFTPVTQEYQDNHVLYASDLLKIGVTFKLDLPIDNAEEGTRGTACDFQVQGRRGASDMDADGEIGSINVRPEVTTGLYVCGFVTPQWIKDAWIDQSSTLDRAARVKKVQDMERAYYEDKDFGYQYIPLHDGSYLVGHWPFVKGGGWDRPWLYRFEQISVEDVWLDKQ